MKKIITLAAIAVLTTGQFALADSCGKKSCCGTCTKGEAVEQSECSKEKSCSKQQKSCAEKSQSCGKGAAAQKGSCSK